MKLTIFNGSPKLKTNNTQVFIDCLIKGMKREGKQEIQVYKLNKLKSFNEAKTLFEQSDTVILAFPLYSYAMPGDIKQFIEILEPLKGTCEGKKVGFIVQFGFQEAIHARPLEKYLKKLTRLLGCTYMGTVIKGGCDSLSKAPRKQFRSVYEGMEEIGKTFATQHCFDAEQLQKFSQPEVTRKKSIWIMKIVLKFINKLYWGKQLKKNGVSVKESFARPYVP